MFVRFKLYKHSQIENPDVNSKSFSCLGALMLVFNESLFEKKGMNEKKDE